MRNSDSKSHVERLLPPDEVHVWFYRLDIGPERENFLRRHLTTNELQRGSRYRFPIHRRRVVAARGSMREILARYVGVDAGTLRFETGEHGKPYLSTPREATRIRFSNTDSDELGGIAVCLNNELGLDMEQLREGRDHERIVVNEFASEEKEWFFGQPEQVRLGSFYALWTCKEAYLKGKGLGLTVPLGDFAIGNIGTPSLLWSNIDSADPTQWGLHRVKVEKGFTACLAVHGKKKVVTCGLWTG